MAETWTCSLRQRGFTNSRYFTRKVIASIHLTPPLPFVLKGERGQGGEGRAAACSTPPRRCKGTLLCDQFCATSASNSSGRIVPAWTLPTAARSPSSPGPFSPNEYIGREGETFDLSGYAIHDARTPMIHPPSTASSTECINMDIGLYANGAIFQSPGAPRQRRTLGHTIPRETKIPMGFHKFQILYT